MVKEFIATGREEILAEINKAESCKIFMEAGFIFGVVEQVDGGFSLVITHPKSDRPIVIKIPKGSRVSIDDKWFDNWESNLIKIS